MHRAILAPFNSMCMYSVQPDGPYVMPTSTRRPRLRSPTAVLRCVAAVCGSEPNTAAKRPITLWRTAGEANIRYAGPFWPATIIAAARLPPNDSCQVPLRSLRTPNSVGDTWLCVEASFDPPQGGMENRTSVCDDLIDFSVHDPGPPLRGAWFAPRFVPANKGWLQLLRALSLAVCLTPLAKC